MKREIKVIIFGAGPHAGVIADIFMNMKGYKLTRFLEKDDIYDTSGVKTKQVTRNMSFPILPDREIFKNHFKSRSERLIVGIGYNLISAREKVVKKLKSKNFLFCSAIHPKSIIADSALIGEGTAVMAGAIVNPFARIGNHAVINTGAVVDHDCAIGDNTFVQPGAHLAGSVRVGQNSIIGIGANIKDGIEIGSNVIIGGGAFVNKNVPDNTVYAGVPAKKLRDNLR